MKHCAREVISSLRLEKMCICTLGSYRPEDQCDYYENDGSIESTCKHNISHVLIRECIKEEVLKEVELSNKLELL